MESNLQGLKVRDRLADVDLSAFAVTAAEYQVMTVDERSDLIDAAYAQAESFIEDVLSESGADWVIVTGEDPAIHSLGTMDESPTDDQKWEMVIEQGIVPHQFFREEFVEVDGVFVVTI